MTLLPSNLIGGVFLAILSMSAASPRAAIQVGSTPYKVSSTGAGNSYAPVFSADGRHVAFVSHANNLVTNDDLAPHLDLFVRDLVASNTVLVSVSTNGFGGANDNIGLYTLSSNAQVIAFETLANNLAHGDTNRLRDIYVRDLASGITRLITPGANGPSSNPLISEDGQRVIFESLASNLVTNDFNGTNDIFIHDLTIGVTVLLVTNVAGITNGGDSSSNAFNGSFIAWDSPDDTLVPDDLNRAWDVFVRNVDTGEITLVSARHLELPASTSTSLARIDAAGTALSAGGERLAVLSPDGVMVPDETNRLRDLFLIDRSNGSRLQAPRPLSPDYPYGTLGGGATAPVISTNGRYVAYGVGSASSSGTNRAIVWLDTQSATNPVLVASLRSGNSTPAMSANGRLVAFHSTDALDRRYPDGNGVSDVFIRLLPPQDLVSCDARDPMAVSLAWSRMQTGGGASFNPVFSPDSRWLLFESLSAVLLPQPLPAQNSAQLYARSIGGSGTGEFDCTLFLNALSNSPALLLSYDTVASLNPAGSSIETPLPSGGSSPRFSADSRFVVFESASHAVYRHDLGIEYIEKVSNIGGVGYTNYARATNDIVCTNCSAPFPSGNGRYVAYESSQGSGGVTNVYWKDMVNGNVELISATMSGTSGNGSSFDPLLTPDGRFVVFASRASDLVPDDKNRAMDIFVRDRWAGTTLCLSENRTGTGTGNGASSDPVLSANGRTIAFHSFASDLVAGDYNNTRDVFLVTIGGPDADRDGMDDDWEMAYFNTLVRDGSGDFDGDGANDRFEFVAGTNPTNNRSILSVLRFTMGQAGGTNGSRTIVLTWSAIPGKKYQVESKADLNASWLPLGSEVMATTTNATVSYELDSAALNARPNAFYRVTVVH